MGKCCLLEACTDVCWATFNVYWPLFGLEGHSPKEKNIHGSKIKTNLLHNQNMYDHTLGLNLACMGQW